MRRWFGSLAGVAILALIGSAIANPSSGTENAVSPILSIPIAAHCVDCTDGCGQDGEESPGYGGNHGHGHGTHEFCWEGETCDSKHGECHAAPAPVADFTDVVEKARQAAISPTSAVFSSF